LIICKKELNHSLKQKPYLEGIASMSAMPGRAGLGSTWMSQHLLEARLCFTLNAGLIYEPADSAELFLICNKKAGLTGFCCTLKVGLCCTLRLAVLSLEELTSSVSGKAGLYTVPSGMASKVPKTGTHFTCQC
jgi:hypothetical protein